MNEPNKKVIISTDPANNFNKLGEVARTIGGYKKSGLGKTCGGLGFHSVSRVKAISEWR